MSNCCTKKKCKCLKFQSSYNFNVPIAGSIFLGLVEKINNYVPCVKVLPKGPDGYVPVLQTEYGLKEGLVDCAFTGLTYTFLRNTVYELYTTMPFGMSATSFVSYLFEEGAIDKLNLEAKKHDLFFYPMALLPPESGGWYNKEINTLDDFKDIKMRIYGLGRNIMEKLGATTFFIPEKEIISSIKAGIINSAEFSTIELDASIGLPKVCKYFYTPSWNQLSTVLYSVCNLQKWNSICYKSQEMIKLILKENMYNNYLFSNNNQIDYLLLYQSQLKSFQNDILDSMKKAWVDWINLPQNKDLKDEYFIMKAYEAKFNSYENFMKNNISQ